MNLLDRSKSWLMFKLSVAIKSKWHPQAMITAENYLDKLKVLHQSENFLAVDKMADLVMNTNPGDERLSLFDQIKHRFPHLHQPGLGHGFYVLHRLDYSTSGVLVVPLSKEAATQGSKQFEKRRTKKFYLALLRGHVEEDRVDIDIPIGELTRKKRYFLLYFFQTSLDRSSISCSKTSGCFKFELFILRKRCFLWTTDVLP